MEWTAELQRQRVRDLLTRKAGIEQLVKRVVAQLNKQIKAGHDVVPFMVAIGVAFIKDASDFFVVATSVTWAINLFLFYFLWGKGYFLKQRIQIIRWGLSFVIESIPVINVLPINTMTMFYAWHVVRKRARKAKKRLDTIQEASREELESIENEINNS